MQRRSCSASTGRALVVVGAWLCPGMGRHGRGRTLDRRGVPALGAVARGAARGDGVVHPRGRAVRGMEINVLAEAIPTHDYESRRSRKAFEEITGIKVNMQIMGEGDVVQAVQTQMQTGRNIYDAYVNDADLIGTHSRLARRGQPHRLDGGRGRRRHQPDARHRRLHRHLLHHRGRTARSGSCPTSSSPTSTGSARTGSTARTCRPSSRRNTATTSACRSTGRPMRTSPSSSPST
jgi:hypothetical protein